VGLIVADEEPSAEAAAIATVGAPAGGVGRLGLRERVAVVGGTLEIESAPGRGTPVLVRVPSPPSLRPDSRAGSAPCTIRVANPE
jgi:signal transduction histidine kinase